MTEQQWRGSTQTKRMLKFLAGKLSGRKFRLLACNFMPHEFLDRQEDKWIYKALSTAQKMAEGTATREEVKQARLTCRNNDGPHPLIVRAVVATLRDNATLAVTSCLSALKQFDSDLGICPMNLALVVRELVGNPFRPVSLNPSWLTPTVLALATGIYEERAFDRMPILADALQDAGCDDEEVLNHCRQPEKHGRGCWCVDLLLGKA